MPETLSLRGKPMSIKIYSSKACTQCKMTKKAYDRDGIAYENVLIDGNEPLQAKLLAQGHTALPVVVTPSETWGGFQPDKIRTSIAEYMATTTLEASITGPSIA